MTLATYEQSTVPQILVQSTGMYVCTVHIKAGPEADHTCWLILNH